MIQAVLRTDCSAHWQRKEGHGFDDGRHPAGGACSRGNAGQADAQTGLVVMVWAMPDDGRFVALASRRRQPRTLDKLGSTMTI